MANIVRKSWNNKKNPESCCLLSFAPEQLTLPCNKLPYSKQFAHNGPNQNYQEIKSTLEPICKNHDHSSLPILKNISYLEISWYLIQSLNFLPLPWLKNTQFSVNDEINFDKIFYSFREKSWRGCDFPQKLCCRRVQVIKIFFALVFCFE